MINTYIKMLNKLLEKYNLKYIHIGIASDKELVIKAGRKSSGINSKVCIGKAVTEVANLSGVANKEFISSIGISSCTHSNLNEHNKNLCTETTFVKNGTKKTCYSSNAIMSEFNKWIDGGM